MFPRPARPRAGSWSQLASKFCRCSLSTNHGRACQVTACGPRGKGAEALIELSRQRKILFGQSARVMGAESQRHFVPADIDVGMMPRFLSQIRDSMYKFHSRRKIFEAVSADDSG